MKRWIHAATSKSLSYKSLANEIKDYLESLGFEGVGIFHTTGPKPVTISVSFDEEDTGDNYSNFIVGLDKYCGGQRYDMNSDEFFRTEEQYAGMIREGILSDVTNYIKYNLDSNITVRSRVDGFHGSYFVVKLFPSIKK